MTILAYGLDVIIAFVFFYSFYSKTGSLSQFKAEIFSYKIVPVYLAAMAAVVVLFIEFSMFLAFSFHFQFFLKEVVVLAILSLFTVLLWIKKKRTSTSACGCFGEAKVLNKYPFVRNFTLIGITVFKLFLPDYRLDFVHSLETSIGIMTLVILYDISVLKVSSKGGD